MSQKKLEYENNGAGDTLWYAIIGGLIISVGVLHYSTPVQYHHLHELYRVFFYIPIILAAFRFQLRGGLTSSLVVIVIYLPHVVFQWRGNFLYNFSRFLEMVMYVVIGLVTGFLAARERNEKLRYQRAAAELELAYTQLKFQSDKMAEMEEQLIHADRLSVLGELSANLAHEVRNPLGSIWGVVEILQQILKGKKASAEFLEILVKEVKRLNDVVENYLSLAKSPQLNKSECNLQEVIDSVFYLLQSRARREQIQLISEMPETPLIVQADENQLRQIIINLLLNSMHAIDEHGEIVVEAGFENESSTLFLEINDTGHGIAPGNLDKIFKPFYTTKSRGTGLGLSIVKRIADQNKWKISVESQPGTGTTIRIMFR
ncbi:sensor histidine kinase [candidate division KSB1 bacterium]|nr:sensor histidine kinase [candidate division KSB1 bacterium]